MVQASIQVPPGRRDFATLADVRAQVPALAVPRVLALHGQLVMAMYWYIPELTVRDEAGRVEITGTNYQVPVDLRSGHVELVFKTADGSVIVDEGSLAGHANPTNGQLGPAGTRQLAGGRTAYTRDLKGPQFPPTGVRVLGWPDPNVIQFSLLSTDLSIDQLAAIAETL